MDPMGFPEYRIHLCNPNDSPRLEFLRSSKENMAEMKGGKKIPDTIVSVERCVKFGKKFDSLKNPGDHRN